MPSDVQQPRIVDLAPTLLVGLRMTMTQTNDLTRQLWSRFMPLVKSIRSRSDDKLISLQQFDESIITRGLLPDTPFIKWAAVAVQHHQEILPELFPYTIQGGRYAVFIHKGTPAMFSRTAAFIYGTWLPSSGYVLDHREHFEIMPPGYRPDDPEAEEEVWVPVRSKS